MTTSYCDVCERGFVDQAALRMHVQHSKIHKKEIRAQKSAQPPETATRLGPSAFKPMHTPQGHRANTRNPFPIPTRGDFGSASGFEDSGPVETGNFKTQAFCFAAENSLSIAMHNLTVSQPQSEYHNVPTAYSHENEGGARAVADEYFGSGASQNITEIIKTRFHCGQHGWSLIPASQQRAALEALLKHCHSSADLTRNSYLLRPRNNDELSGNRKCKNCGGRQKALQARLHSLCSFHPKKQQIGKRNDQPKLYPCCGTIGPGCCSLNTHTYPDLDQRLLAKNNALASSPLSSPQALKLQAVALDCEMAGIRGGMSELVYVCAVNYLTGETILNTLVRPNGHVIDWRTRYSGVTEELMTAAANRGETLNGWKEARAQLWEYIDADTVLVGHSLHHDLDALRMIHNRVVDSSILASSAVNPTKISGWGLRRLCGQLLDMRIQDHGRSGHDCLEDTLATRELVLFCTLNPQHLETWAENRREEEKAKEEQIRMERERRKRGTERENEKEQEGIKKQLHDIRS